MFSRVGHTLHPNVVVCLVATVVTLLVTGFTLAVAAPLGHASAGPPHRNRSITSALAYLGHPFNP
jgi:hypothetical protein